MNILFFLQPKSETAFIYDYNTLRQVLEIMEHHQYSCIPMLNKEGKYAGTITEGDLLWGLKEQESFNLKETEQIAIHKVKRRFDYKCVKVTSNMEDLIEKAMAQNFVPVTDDQDYFIGIVTRKSIIKFCYQKIQENN